MSILMNSVRLPGDPVVDKAVEEAATSACQTLDEIFPGGDRAGINSDFQAALVAAIHHMLKGGSLSDIRCNHSNPHMLVISDNFFGKPIDGKMFLVVRDGERQWCNDRARLGAPERLALQPDATKFRAIAKCTDAFTSFEAAARAAKQYFDGEEMTIDAVRECNVRVVSVAFLPNADEGFVEPK